MNLTNKPMKRLSLYLFLILFTLQAPSLADDISDFQIEGVDITNSLLDFFTEEDIKKYAGYIYPSKKFQLINLDSSELVNNDIYDNVQASFKPKDKNYEIYSIDGMIYYNSNFKECYSTKNKIVDEIKEMFTSIEQKNLAPFKHNADPSGETIIHSTNFEFKSGAIISVGCTDWKEELTKNNGWKDSLRVSIVSKEFFHFTTYEAYN